MRSFVVLSRARCVGSRLQLGSAEPFLGVGQQDGEGWAFGVFEFDSDGVTAFAEADVGDDGGRAQLVAPLGQGGAAGVDHVGRGGPAVVGVGACGDRLGLSVGANDNRVGEELAALGELLLGEAEGWIEQSVEVVLRLR